MKRSDLETLAQQEVRTARKEGREPREIVGIGFKMIWAADVVWIELPNTAEAPDEFLVTAEDLYHAVDRVKRHYGIESSMSVDYVDIWHSHNKHEEPSRIDVQSFDSDLFRVGYVYFTPAGSSRVYDRFGVISPLTLSTPRTTGAI